MSESRTAEQNIIAARNIEIKQLKAENAKIKQENERHEKRWQELEFEVKISTIPEFFKKHILAIMEKLEKAVESE